MSTTTVRTAAPTARTTVPPRRPSAAFRDPLVVPLNPRRGWAAASPTSRKLAVAAVPLATLLALVDVGAFAVTWLAVGPLACYRLARVLRPELSGGERTVRHWLGSTGTAYCLPALLAGSAPAGLQVSNGNDGLLFPCLIAAALLLASTLPWGVLALLVRTWAAVRAARR